MIFKNLFKDTNAMTYVEFLKTRPVVREDRNKSKYYKEMQELSYLMLKYLTMNTDENEHNCQGNYNLTYFIENLTTEEYLFILSKLSRRCKPTDFANIRDGREIKFSINNYKINNRYKVHFYEGIEVDGDILEYIDTIEIAFEFKVKSDDFIINEAKKRIKNLPEKFTGKVYKF